MTEIHESCYLMIRNLSRDLTLSQLREQRLKDAFEIFLPRLDPLDMTPSERLAYEVVAKQLTNCPKSD